MARKKRKTTTRRRKTTRKRKVRKPLPEISISPETRREIEVITLFAASVLIGLSLFGNLGLIGEMIDSASGLLLGSAKWLLPFVTFILGGLAYIKEGESTSFTRGVGVIALLIAIAGLFHVSVPMEELLTVAEARSGGGYAGFIITFALRHTIGVVGASIVLIVAAICSVLVSCDISISQIFNVLHEEFASGQTVEISGPGVSAKEAKAQKTKKEPKEPASKPTHKVRIVTGTAKRAKLQGKGAVKKEETNFTPKSGKIAGWILPDLDLLDDDEFSIISDEKTVKKNAEIIARTLQHFNIDVEMRNVNIGPTVVQYTLKPAEGIKLSKITGLQNDLALALAAKSIRIEAPIPGKALVGIEIPNDKRATVKLRSILESREFTSRSSPLKTVLGRDVSGVPILDDIASMPHMLIAGATGAGKSVYINALLLTLLYQNSPNHLKFIMVDPKRVELNAYNNIPHLLTPVITDPEKTISALRWAVAEMNTRYKMMQEHNVKNIADFNKAHPDKALPYIVIIIDELADLMMAAPKEVEALICRIAQMARAIGIHLILATQRPSVDVITGLIKANIPSRVAFTVSSSIDSRTVIDTVGAEKLLGAGDMLYINSRMSKPLRLQSVYVSPAEVIRVTNEIKLTAQPEYNEEIVKEGQPVPMGIPQSKVQMTSGDDEDDMLSDAIQVILENKKASASLLQRRLKVGYARAARMLDMLEQKGMIGPADGAKPRTILISHAQTEEPKEDEVTPI